MGAHCLEVVHTPQVCLGAVAQAALEAAFAPFDGAGDRGFVDADLLADLPHVFPLGVVHQNHLSLLLGDILPQTADQVAFQAADLPAVVGGHLAAVHSHIGGVQLALSISCIWHSCDTPCRNSAL